MKTYTYYEQNQTKTLIAAFIYLIVLIGGALWGFGGLANLLDAISYIGGGIVVGALIGLVIGVGLLGIQMLILKKVTIDLSKDQLIIRKKGEADKIILLTDINVIKLNIDKINRAELLDANNQSLFTILSAINKNKKLEKLIQALAAFLKLDKEVVRKKSTFKNYESILYTKKTAA